MNLQNICMWMNGDTDQKQLVILRIVPNSPCPVKIMRSCKNPGYLLVNKGKRRLIQSQKLEIEPHIQSEKRRKRY